MKVNEIQISYFPEVTGNISCSNDCFKVLRKAWDEDTLQMYEQFKVIYLNQGNQILGIRTVGTGGINFTPVDIRIIFSIGLKMLATAIVVAHNHPSGSLNPSEADKKITKKIKDAGELLDIKILDHIILTKDSYCSFADEGLL